MAVQPSDERWKTKGWGLTSWQIFGAIVPIAKLYGFDARKVNQAIGVGCESSTLPTAYHATTMSDFYHYEHGYRARDGFMIAKSVEKGIHNQLDALDEPRCYTGVICDDADLSWLTRDLGKWYLTMETLMKHWPGQHVGTDLCGDRCTTCTRSTASRPRMWKRWHRGPAGGPSVCGRRRGLHLRDPRPVLRPLCSGGYAVRPPSRRPVVHAGEYEESQGHRPCQAGKRRHVPHGLPADRGSSSSARVPTP